MGDRMRPVFSILAAGLTLFLLPASSYSQLSRHADPFLGADGGGNVFPAPSLPFGMIRPGPDTVTSGDSDANAGWAAQGDIRGFSQTHVGGPEAARSAGTSW